MKSNLEKIKGMGKVELLNFALEVGEESKDYRSTLNKNRPFRNRKFLAIDGEGVNHPEKAPTQSYVLLGVSDGESLDVVSDYDLSTYQCLEFLMSMHDKYPWHIMVSYSFNYDTSMIIKDFSEDQKRRVYKGETILWCGYRVRVLRGKWIEIWQGRNYTKIFDVFSFFQCKFTTACGDYIGDDELYLDISDEVAHGKGLRDTFEYSDLETIIKPYMHKELKLLVRLMNQLRDLLASVDLHPQGWHGPGAIASSLLSLHRISKHRPKEDSHYVTTATQYAYAGGRFEGFKTGLYYGDVYSYDIRSAYPYALTQVPSLDESFTVDSDATDVPDFSLCRVSYVDRSISRTGINPFALRSRGGSIYYPNAVATWVWGCEYKIAKKWFGDRVHCSEVIRFADNGVRPFAFIEDLFSKRQSFKRVNNPVQLACKLGMNSIYGKLAQRIGWDEVNNKAPHHHQLRIAGFCTAMCRSMVLDAMMQAPEAMIAVETDGIYSEKPLTLDIGKNLGQYEESRYSGMLFMQSGVYFTLSDLDYPKELGYDEWSAGKTRGFTPNKANVDVAMSTVQTLEPVKISQRRFYGLPGAVGKSTERSWGDEPRRLEWGGGGKRAHRPEYCSACSHGDLWHSTAWTPSTDPNSHKHPLPWMAD